MPQGLSPDSVICCNISPKDIHQDSRFELALSVPFGSRATAPTGYCHSMTAVLLPRTENMTAFNAHIELDDVHTPSRYIAIAFICSTLGCQLCLTSNRLPVSSSIMSFLLVLLYLRVLSSGRLGLKFLIKWIPMDKQYHIKDRIACLNSALDNPLGHITLDDHPGHDSTRVQWTFV